MKKQMIALTTGLSVLATSPLGALAEEVNKFGDDQLRIAEGERVESNNLYNLDVNNENKENTEVEIKEVAPKQEGVGVAEVEHEHATVEDMQKAKTGNVFENEALDNIHKAFIGGDGKGDGSSREMQNNNATRTGVNDNLVRASQKHGSIAGIPFVEWIVPKGNTDIRPANPMKPKYITIHETANTAPGANAENHAKYLHNQATNGTFRTASWHFTVDDKQIYQHLPTNENGWHAGDGNGSGNMESIGIEIAVNQDGDYNKAVENAQKLVAHLMKQEGISVDNLRRHQQWSGKKCPDIMISRGNWNNFVSGTKNFTGQGEGIDKPLEEKEENIDENEFNPAEPNIKLTINGNGVNVRNGAGKYYGVVRKLNKGAEFKVKAVKDGWYEIEKGQWVFFDSSYIKLAYNAYDKNPNPNPEKPQVTGKEIKVNGIGVNIREGAGTGYRSVGKAPRGKTYKVQEESNGWIKIGDKQWIYNDSSYIQTITQGGGNNNESNGGNQVQIGKEIKVKGYGVRMRSGAGTGHSQVGTASYGQEFTVQEESDGWVKIGNNQWIFNDPNYIQTIVQGNGNNNGGQVQTGKKIKVKGYGVRMRSGAGVKHSQVGTAGYDQEFTVQEESNGWVKVGDGKWIFNDSSYIQTILLYKKGLTVG
ncbi:TPA: SH3 domain-containing protein [Bacillus cereus]